MEFLHAIIVLSNFVFHSHHGVSLTRSSLTISKHSCRIALECRVDQILDTTLVEHLLLRGLLWKNVIKSKLFHSLF